ncbi:M48 family metallopeptidase [Natrinema gari]
MILSVTLLVMATTGFVISIWGVFVGILLFFRVPLSTAMLLSAVPTIVLLLGVVVLEYRGPATIERAATATPVPVEDYPELHATVNRVASMLDIPAPTIAVSDSPAPEAMVVGVRPTAIRLILSTGTLKALDENELEAVIAHELAHVKNRDAIVMTVISVPTVLAAGLVARFPELADRDLVTAILLTIVGLVGLVITQGIVAVCSRTRELAADRAAVEVIGSAGPLASALRTLDRRIETMPSEDLRAVNSVSALSILPLKLRTDDEESVTYWDEDDNVTSPWSLRKSSPRFRSQFFRTHPPTEKRLELISDYGM